jgi:membrane protein DedA with SNARE-associated domain
MESLFEPLTGPFAAWVGAHAAWAGPLVFLIAFAESLVIVSALMPATILLLAIGTLAGPGGPLDLAALCAWGIAGAGSGFWVSYELGRRWSARILAIGWLARRPELVARGHDFFARWGMAAIFVARFVGPARVVVPLLAGALGERPRGFHLGNWISAIVWTPLLLAPTTAANWVSAQIESLPPSMRAPAVLALVVIAVIVWRAWRERVSDKR